MSTGESAPQAGNDQITASPPQGGAAITAGPPAGERIELPQRPAAAPVERVDPRRGRMLDGILCVLLLALAFLCASFEARNTDVFQSLATGRLLARGEYSFGVDPYSFASAGAWVNQSWLYDLGVYAVYGLDPSGAALVVIKALLVVALAWLMLRAGATAGEKLWVPILCTTVGVLALSPRVVLQSSVLSMLFLGVTIFLLLRSAERPGRLWLLPPLCLLWVNLDAWFLVGPITVACFYIGKLVGTGLGEEPAATPGQKAAPLGPVLLACLAACLCNPHHVHAFTSLPVGLVGSGMEAFKKDNAFRGFFLSPWLDSGIYFQENIGRSVAGISYFVLLALSLASFASLGVCRPAAFRWSRLLVWLFFVLLSGVAQIRAIPFFAIVAAPIAALNFADLIRQAGGTAGSRQVWDAWAMPGRVFTFLGLLALCVASISGAVQAKPHYRREIGWGVVVDPGLAGAAKQIAAWRADGVVGPGQKWLTLTPEVGNYLAWFAPGEKGFVDQRLSLFTEVAPTMFALRRSLSGDDGQQTGQPPTFGYRKTCRELGVTFLVHHNADPSRPTAMLTRLFSNPKEFVPVFVEGGAAVFAWRDPEAGSPPALDPRLVLDFAKRAFGKGDEVAPESPTPAPAWHWWHPLLRAEAGSPPELTLALQYSTRFDALAPRYQEDSRRSWFGMAGGSLAIAGATPGGPLASLPSFFWRLSLAPRFEFMQDSGPPDSLYLAIRACRRALAKNPEDAPTQLALARNYFRLKSMTRERPRTKVERPDGPDQPFFVQADLIRQTQIAAALQAVLKGEPSKEQAQLAHSLLAFAFSDPQFLESRVMHLKKYQELSRELKYLPFGPAERYAEEMKNLDAEVKKLDRQLKNKLDQYEVTASSRRGENQVMEKVHIAMRNGLSEKALNMLIDAKTGRSEIVMLLLGMGRIDDAAEVLTPQPGQEDTFDPRAFGIHAVLGVPAYEWFQVQRSAAAGDYASADRYLVEALAVFRKDRAFIDALDLLDGMSRSPLDQGAEQMFQQIRLRTVGQEASLLTVRAWLALEAGYIGIARESAREAFTLRDRIGGDPRVYVSLPLAGLVQDLVAEGGR